jgi:voltage-gated potassium channel
MDGIDHRRLAGAVAFALAALVGGTIGFRAFLHEPWHAALYRTIMTASLTGLDSTPKGPAAETLTIILVLAGVAIFGYLAAQIADAIARGALSGAWKDSRRRKMIDELQDHVIVCGYGRVGRRAGEELRTAGHPFVVLDFDERALEFAQEHGDLWVEGNGSEDDDLERAGIDRARGILVASDSDADNLYITLSAKTRRPGLIVISRASSEAAERKLRLAGADRVVTPYASAGRVMANLLLKPEVTAFVSEVTSSRSPGFSIDEVVVQGGCAAVGRTIGELEANRTGATVVAIRSDGEAFRTRPAKETKLLVGDVVVVAGAPDELAAIEALFATRQSRAG